MKKGRWNEKTTFVCVCVALWMFRERLNLVPLAMANIGNLQSKEFSELSAPGMKGGKEGDR
jgi:hypothetical protein